MRNFVGPCDIPPQRIRRDKHSATNADGRQSTTCNQPLHRAKRDAAELVSSFPK